MDKSKKYWVIFACLAIWGAWEWRADFLGNTISYALPYHPEWEVTPSVDEGWLKEFLSNKFYWLDQGHQVHVFTPGENFPYVLKVFKFRRLKPAFGEESFSSLPIFSSYYQQLQKQRTIRFDKLFNGYLLAYTRDQEYTGIHYIHLNHTALPFKQEMTLVDRFGIEHQVCCEDLSFAIQKIGKKTETVLKELLDRGDLATAKRRIRQIFEMYQAEYKLGILDRDHNIMKNTGFADEKPIRLDIGQLRTAPDAKTFHAVLQRIADKRIYGWLKRRYPEAAEELAGELKRQ